jgi:hypothetical protein
MAHFDFAPSKSFGWSGATLSRPSDVRAFVHQPDISVGGEEPTSGGLGRASSIRAALLPARGSEFLSVFDKPQRDALVMVFLRMHGQGVLANEVFWGLWLFPSRTTPCRKAIATDLAATIQSNPWATLSVPLFRRVAQF